MFATSALLLLLVVDPGPAPVFRAGRIASRVDRSAEAPAADPIAADTTAAAEGLDPHVTSPAAESAIALIDPTMQLRIIGAFGEFHGYAGTVDATGLHGLRPAPGIGMILGLHELRWGEIERIDIRRGNVRKGATLGAVLVGALGTGFGAMIGSGFGSLDGATQSDKVTLTLAGAGAGLLVGSAVGALTGAGVGAAVPSWHTVYVRP